MRATARVMEAVGLVALVASACAPAPPSVGDPAYQHPGEYVERTHEDPSDEIYEPDALPRFDLELPPASLEALMRAPRTYAPARLTYRGETWQVGVHLRGENSFRTLAGKASFKVKMDEFVRGQTLRGLAGLVLKNSVQDDTHVAECLTYDVAAAAGVPAPRCNNAMVWVNGAYFGVYANVEATDKRFLVRHFGTSQGNLYEETGADLVPEGVATFERKNHEERTDRSDLAKAADAIAAARPASFAEDVAAALDLGGFLRFAALELLVGQHDGYAYRPFGRNNFLLYGHPLTRQLHFLPNGMDQTFRSALPTEIAHAAIDDAIVYLDAEDARGIVLETCLRGAACRARYADAVLAVAAAFESLDLPARAETRMARLAPALAADPRREVGDETLARRRGELLRYARERVASVRAALGRGALD